MSRAEVISAPSAILPLSRLCLRTKPPLTGTRTDPRHTVSLLAGHVIDALALTGDVALDAALFRRVIVGCQPLAPARARVTLCRGKALNTPLQVAGGMKRNL